MLTRAKIDLMLDEQEAGERSGRALARRMLRFMSPLFPVRQTPAATDAGLRPFMVLTSSWLSDVYAQSALDTARPAEDQSGDSGQPPLARDPLFAFLQTLGFNWGDVRELGDDDPLSFDLERYCQCLLRTDGCLCPEEAHTAFRLIAKWLTTAEAEHGDITPERDFFVWRMMDRSPGHNIAEELSRSHFHSVNWLFQSLMSITWLNLFVWLFFTQGHSVFHAIICLAHLALLGSALTHHFSFRRRHRLAIAKVNTLLHL